jgi:ribosomal protein L30
MPSEGGKKSTTATKKKTTKKKAVAKKTATRKSATKKSTTKKKTAKKSTTKAATAKSTTAPKKSVKKTDVALDKLRVRQVRSGIGSARPVRRTLTALGLKHHQDEVVVPDNSSIRGMLNKVHHLVSVKSEEANV